MIRKLRIRFVAVAMAAVFAVLFVIMLVVNLVNYTNVGKDADNLTSLIAQRAGGFDRFFEGYQPEGGEQVPQGEGGEQQLPPDGEGGEQQLPPNMHQPDDRSSRSETPFETRFFVVTIQGDTVTTNTAQIAAVSEEEAVTMARKVLAGSKTRGYSGVYRYLVDGDTVVFVDCTRQLAAAKFFLLVSLLVSAGGLLAVFVLVVLFSGRIVKPFVLNYERQKRFVTEASHELKTPLTIISANNELIEMEAGESDFTHAIAGQVERMNGMVRNMTALARLDELDGLKDKADFDLSAAVTDVAWLFTAPLGEGFQLDVAPDIHLEGNENLIRQLVSILLDNAVKYSTGSTTLTLAGGKHPTLSVSNPADDTDGDKSAYLERFGRGDNARAKVEGSGIGLAIAREIVTLHHGKIEAA
ncbi:MAG: HAMP domain-containing histidine kinase, partial [Clostridia bacterium]|nr:HAMP domain-containing histidine kinase [Clostridia bacterium]